MTDQGLRRSDFGWILAYCMALFAVLLLVGGPLTMHEGVLSQTSRQMLADHDWVIPHFGQGPWLERPPLPQWLTVGIATLVGRCDEEWIVRIGPALSGTLTVLLTAWLGGALFGRAAGILGALILATMYQFARYSTLAEADMFLCPIVASCVCLFAYLELVRLRGEESINFLGRRPWPILGFFVLLGMTNLAKGLVFGMAMALVPIGGYLLWNFNVRGMLRYVWLWGWLACAAAALAWPVLAYQRYSDVVVLWDFDLFARLHGDYLAEPRWYYLANWLWVVLPWPVAGIMGLCMTARGAFKEGNKPLRLLWCWALLTPLVFSYARSKHHHYMIHFLAPWALLSSLAVLRMWQRAQSWPTWLRRPAIVPGFFAMVGPVVWLVGARLPGPSWVTALALASLPAAMGVLWWLGFHRQGRVALAGSFSLLLGLYWLGFTYKSQYLHRSNDDTAFLREACELASPEAPLLVHAVDEALEGLRILFYCPDRTRLLHNMTFLHDDALRVPSVYVIARGKELPRLSHYGQASVLLQSVKSRREESPADRWTLFHLEPRADLAHRSGKVRISPMQAMYRAAGPSLE